MDRVIERSEISEKKVEIYEGVRITDSKIEENCILGDFSRITHSELKGFNKIDRNSLIYYSQFGLCSYIGINSVVMHSEVGKYCSLSWGVTIGPANHDYEYISSHDFLYNDFYGIKSPLEPAVYNRFSQKTKIGNDVWIGTHSTILNGISVGDGAVIGANSIVTKDVPPYAIVVGNPGRVVGYRFDDEIIEKLIALKWWDFSMDLIKSNFHLFKSKDIEELIEKLNELKR